MPRMNFDLPGWTVLAKRIAMLPNTCASSAQRCSSFQLRERRDKKSPNRDKTAKHRDRPPGQNRDTSRAQENPLGFYVPLSRGTDRDGTQATGTGHKFQEIAGGSVLTTALNNRQENFA